MNPIFSIYFSFITGVMVGIEFEFENEDNNYIILDLFIVQVMIEWAK